MVISPIPVLLCPSSSSPSSLPPLPHRARTFLSPSRRQTRTVVVVVVVVVVVSSRIDVVVVVSSGTDLYDDVVDVTSFSALDVVEIKLKKNVVVVVFFVVCVLDAVEIKKVVVVVGVVFSARSSWNNSKNLRIPLNKNVCSNTPEYYLCSPQNTSVQPIVEKKESLSSLSLSVLDVVGTNQNASEYL